MGKRFNKHDWEVAAKGLLKSEMIHREIDYVQLSRLLVKMGIPNASPDNLRSKINRGSFSATFLIQSLLALGCEEINIKNLPITKRL
ncbi:hypothetical protein MNBD_GAMMA26-859 [hydrothermal vent metagenome]|uniref:DUF6471 domain-containing protein n=1 Tax=hydrothermal vent metagenome TaxID=652676 RepID=A0A3B1C2X8_9ZZZZ